MTFDKVEEELYKNLSREILKEIHPEMSDEEIEKLMEIKDE